MSGSPFRPDTCLGAAADRGNWLRAFAPTVAVVCLLSCSLAARPLLAATIKPATLEQLVGDSQLIVKGTVTNRSSRWTDDRRFIVTDYRFEWRKFCAT